VTHLFDERDVGLDQRQEVAKLFAISEDPQMRRSGLPNDAKDKAILLFFALSKLVAEASRRGAQILGSVCIVGQKCCTLVVWDAIPRIFIDHIDHHFEEFFECGAIAVGAREA